MCIRDSSREHVPEQLIRVLYKLQQIGKAALHRFKLLLRLQQVVCNSQNQKRQQFFPAELPSLVFQSLILLLHEDLSLLDASGIGLRAEGLSLIHI